MKKIYFLILFFSSYSLIITAQNIELNPITSKYEISFEISEIKKSKSEIFELTNEWLLMQYNLPECIPLKSDLSKGIILYRGAFITNLFPTKGMITFNIDLKIEEKMMSAVVTNFFYKNMDSYGFIIDFESKNLTGKKKIIPETENKLNKDFEALKNLILN